MDFRVLTIDEIEYLTPEMVRKWGYDEKLYLMAQDEDLLLHEAQFIPVLIELSADEKCPKQQGIAATLNQYSQFVLLSHLVDEARKIYEEAVATPFATSPVISLWRKWYLELFERLVTPRPLSSEEAERIAWRLSVGDYCSRDFEKTSRTHNGYSEYLASTSTYSLYVYVNESTGDWKSHGSRPWEPPEIPRELATRLGAFHMDSPLSLPRWLLIFQATLVTIASVGLLSSMGFIPKDIIPRNVILVTGATSTFLCPLFIAMWTDEASLGKRASFVMLSIILSCVSLAITSLQL